MDRAGKCALYGLSLGPLASFLLGGCQTIERAADIGAQLGVGSGLLNASQAEAIRKSAAAAAPAFERFTPEQEYYIGRTVGAHILERYPPYGDPAANRYVNLVGQTLAGASDMPQTFGGYHFLIQDSAEINALAAPGGLVFVTRGLLRCCRGEDALAAVLAHEIGHVQLKHGLQAIQTSRITKALATIGVEGAKQLTGSELAGLTETFEDTVKDITAKLINSGYSRSSELEADGAAVDLLERVGYRPRGLQDMLEEMDERIQADRPDFAKTHPAPRDRITALLKREGAMAPVAAPAARKRRFARAMGKI